MAERVTTIVMNVDMAGIGTLSGSAVYEKLGKMFPECEADPDLRGRFSGLGEELLIEREDHLITRTEEGRIAAVFVNDRADGLPIAEKITITGLDSFTAFSITRAGKKTEEPGIYKANSAGIIETSFEVLPGSVVFMLQQA